MIIQKLLFVIAFLAISLQGRSEEQTDTLETGRMQMREIFANMPDSIVPTLTINNRLDMIDFIDSNMKAEVTNLLGGTSEMTLLTDDRMSVKMSDAYSLNFILVNTIDDNIPLICMCRTYGCEENGKSTVIEYYTPQWERVEGTPNLSSDDITKIEAFDMQTFVKWHVGVLKER